MMTYFDLLHSTDDELTPRERSRKRRMMEPDYQVFNDTKKGSKIYEAIEQKKAEGWRLVEVDSYGINGRRYTTATMLKDGEYITLNKNGGTGGYSGRN